MYYAKKMVFYCMQQVQKSQETENVVFFITNMI